MALVASAAVFLRWLPHHGLFASSLVTAAAVTALAIYLNRKRRFQRAVRGINQQAMAADAASTTAVAVSVVVLAALGIYTVLFLPL